MNAQEVGQLLGLIAARYPNGRLGQDEELTIQAWHLTLSDIPLRPHAERALRDWFERKPFAPDASEVRRLALELGGPTPAMLSEAAYHRATQAHWTAMCALGGLPAEERRARHAAYCAELRRQDPEVEPAVGPAEVERLKAVAGGA